MWLSSSGLLRLTVNIKSRNNTKHIIQLYSNHQDQNEDPTWSGKMCFMSLWAGCEEIFTWQIFKRSSKLFACSKSYKNVVIWNIIKTWFYQICLVEFLISFSICHESLAHLVCVGQEWSHTSGIANRLESRNVLSKLPFEMNPFLREINLLWVWLPALRRKLEVFSSNFLLTFWRFLVHFSSPFSQLDDYFLFSKPVSTGEKESKFFFLFWNQNLDNCQIHFAFSFKS